MNQQKNKQEETRGFFETKRVVKFIDHQIPAMIASINRLAAAIEKYNEAQLGVENNNKKNNSKESKANLSKDDVSVLMADMTLDMDDIQNEPDAKDYLVDNNPNEYRKPEQEIEIAIEEPAPEEPLKDEEKRADDLSELITEEKEDNNIKTQGNDDLDELIIEEENRDSIKEQDASDLTELIIEEKEDDNTKEQNDEVIDIKIDEPQISEPENVTYDTTNKIEEPVIEETASKPEWAYFEDGNLKVVLQALEEEGEITCKIPRRNIYKLAVLMQDVGDEVINTIAAVYLKLSNNKFYGISDIDNVEYQIDNAINLKDAVMQFEKTINQLKYKSGR